MHIDYRIFEQWLMYGTLALVFIELLIDISGIFKNSKYEFFMPITCGLITLFLFAFFLFTK